MVYQSPAQGQLGGRVFLSGDQDRDGIEDVGATLSRRDAATELVIYLSGGGVRRLEIEVTAGDITSAAGGGDWDSDRVDDIALGLGSWGPDDAGAIIVVSGIDGDTLWMEHGHDSGARLGASLTSLNDGALKVAAGAPGSPGGGAVFGYGPRHSDVLWRNDGKSSREVMAGVSLDSRVVDGDLLLAVGASAHRFAKEPTVGEVVLVRVRDR